MPRMLRGVGVAGLAMEGYRLWRRLPPNQRELVLAQVRKNGPRIARTAIVLVRSRKVR